MHGFDGRDPAEFFEEILLLSLKEEGQKKEHQLLVNVVGIHRSLLVLEFEPTANFAVKYCYRAVLDIIKKQKVRNPRIDTLYKELSKLIHGQELFSEKATLDIIPPETFSEYVVKIRNLNLMVGTYLAVGMLGGEIQRLGKPFTLQDGIDSIVTQRAEVSNEQ